MIKNHFNLRDATIVFLIPGILQGLALHYFVEKYQDVIPEFFWAVVQFLLLAPLAFFLTARDARRLVSVSFGLGLGAFIAGLTYWMQTRLAVVQDSSGLLAEVSIVCGALIFCIAIPTFRTLVGQKKPLNHYPSLFESYWNLPFILGGSLFFIGSIWAVLGLWAELFQLLNISFFTDIFFTEGTYWCVNTGAGALAICIWTTREGTILALRKPFFILLRILVPIYTLTCLLFVPTVLIQGLDNPWPDWSATVLMLIAIGFSVMLTNVTVSDRGVPDNLFLSWSIRLLGVLTLFLAGFAAVSVGLRIETYGMTVERFYAAVAVCVASLYTLLYGVCAIWPRQYTLLRQGNIVLTGGVFVLAVLLQTPLLDARRLSATSQLARLVAGKVSASDFDYAYARFEMGEEGERLLKKLEILDHPEKEIIAAELAEIQSFDSAAARKKKKNRQRRLAYFAHVELIGTAANLSDDEKLDIHDDFYDLRYCEQENTTCIIVPVEGYDMLQVTHLLVYFDGTREKTRVHYRLLKPNATPSVGTQNIVLRSDGDMQTLLAQLRQGPVLVTTLPVKTLRLGDHVLIPKLDNAHSIVALPE